MALKSSKTLTVVNRQVTFDDCYCKVSSVSGSKTAMTAVVEFRTLAGGDIVSIAGYVFDHDCDSSDGVFRQAYLHLKTLPEFANAVDC